MGILGLFSSKVLAAGYGVVFGQVMFVLVAKTVSVFFFFFGGKAKLFQVEGPKQNLKRERVWEVARESLGWKRRGPRVFLSLLG